MNHSLGIVIESLVAFFFQAEDGIRDADVTGVQTCALPIWRLRETEIRKDFAERVRCREERREEGDLESMWKGLKDCLLEETEAVCGKTKGRARHKITWWWNKDTELAVKDKRRAYELWKKSGLKVDKGAYMLAKGRSKRDVAKATED